MQKMLVPLLGLAGLLVACTAQPHAADAATQGRGRDAGEQTLRDAAAARDAGAPLDARAQGDSGDTNHMNVDTAACDAMRCEHQGDELAKSLRTSAPVALTVKGGDCARVDIDGDISGMACTCQTSNGWLYIGPKGAGCFARGRAGDCLWDDSEFAPCTAGDPKCEGLCQELEQRYAADAAKMFDVEVRLSTCRNDSCRHVLRIEHACYTDRSIASGRRYDCSLSAAEILDREDTTR